MADAPGIQPAVKEARRKLAEGREALRADHERGLPATDVCRRCTAMVDDVVTSLYEAAASKAESQLEDQVALVAVGGYGRGDLAPHSDIDLMVLHHVRDEQEVAALVRPLMRDLSDTGMKLGFSLRTPAQACQLAWSDATIFTSLVELRHLAGSLDVFEQFQERFRRAVRRQWPALVEQALEARREERRQYGETVYLLEPNVKRSRGGLRDLQLLRWTAFARYGEREWTALAERGLLTPDDARAMQEAYEFLLRLRNELHFHAGRTADVLSRDEQLRIAELFGYRAEPPRMPVEQFLTEYIEHTNQVRYRVAHFVATVRRRTTASSVVTPLFSHRVGRDYRVDSRQIKATARGLKKLRQDVSEVLRLMDLANRYGTRIDHATWMDVRNHMERQGQVPVTAAAAKRFLSLLSVPGNLGDLLRRLHELRVLERLIPPMAAARALMQFNNYHKFTVDEHSIRAVQCATGFANDPGPIGDAYRSISDKTVLHVALLLHDLGKGYPGDHSEVGATLAAETARHLGLGARETETLVLLVRHHLLMSHLAQRRDIYDDAVVLQLAVTVGSLEVLRMLYVLTCADLAAVGPGVLNNWRRDLITQLFFRTRDRLAGDDRGQAHPDAVRRCEEVLASLPAGADRKWWQSQLSILPPGYLAETAADEILTHLEGLRTLAANQALAWGTYRPERKAVEYIVGTRESVCPGIFYKLTGALTSKGHQILAAEIHTLTEDWVLDRFFVVDQDYAGCPPEERIDEVTAALVSALTGPQGDHPAFRRLWQSKASPTTAQAMRLPTQIRIDNNSSPRHTIIDIFAHDQMGLLFAITRTLFELGLSVHRAKIGTYLDQVVDVFYVTSAEGAKVEDEARLRHIQQELGRAIDAVADASRPVAESE